MPGKRDAILTIPGSYGDTRGIPWYWGNSASVPIRGFICYAFGFGTRRRETESNRLHLESGSGILRKCPPVAGGSVDAGPVCENGSAGADGNFKAENRQEAHVAYFLSDLPQGRGDRRNGRRDSHGNCSACPSAGSPSAGSPSAGSPRAGPPPPRGPPPPTSQRSG